MKSFFSDKWICIDKFKILTIPIGQISHKTIDTMHKQHFSGPKTPLKQFYNTIFNFSEKKIFGLKNH